MTTHPLVDMWNNLSAKHPNNPRVLHISPSRMTKINMRWKQLSQEEWGIVFQKLSDSSFLRGEMSAFSEDHPRWRATFDWLISNDRNCVKILEGNYDDRDYAGNAPITGKYAKISHKVPEVPKGVDDLQE